MEVLPTKVDRVKGQRYTFKNRTVIWDGRLLKCEHNREKNTCKECGGASICEHGRLRSTCKECDSDGHLISIMRNRVRFALKNYTENKKCHTMEYVGCTIEELRIHLEKQFEEGMTWENIGEWHIDHRRPCASFNLSGEEEKHKCFHFTNLQPLWGLDNLSKGASYNEDTYDRKWNDEEGRWEDK